MRPKAEVNDTTFRISYHARLRYMMRINRRESLDSETVEDSKKITLPEKYVKGLWNEEKGAHFLIKGDTVATVIRSNLNGRELSDRQVKSCDCEAVIHPDYNGEECSWCGEKI